MKKQVNDRITIRLARPQDEYTIVKIQFNAFKVLAIKDYNSKQLNALLKSKSKPRKSREIILIAEIDQQPVGFASLLHPFNMIGAVFVSPNFARKGIGSKLLQSLEQEAIKYNVPILWVCSSLTGYSFYQANGYRTVRKTVLPLYSTYIPCIQMKKRLLSVTKKEILQEVYQLLVIVFGIILIITFFS